MLYAFPYDELRPLTCDGRVNRERGDLDINVANYSLTLIDSLESLAIFNRTADFKWASNYIANKVSFDKDAVVSSFEINIRVIGGLLGAHFNAEKLIDTYDGGLLRKAIDVADRLLPVFKTPTGIPYSRINFRKGVPKGTGRTTSTAEAASYLIEFGILSMLTGDIKYYQAARNSVVAIWKKRSSLHMMGGHISVITGEFTETYSSTGPGQDSFYEYLLKGYILFNDELLFDIFLQTYHAIQKYHTMEGFTYKAEIFHGVLNSRSLSPLQAFWIGVQVLAGDTISAIKAHSYWYNAWNTFSALPEVIDVDSSGLSAGTYRDSPLRPELIEATYYLALQNQTSIYFNRTIEFVDSLNSRSRVKCGFAALNDVLTGKLDNRMDSYFLSETLVYLYLIAVGRTPEHLPFDIMRGEVIFTTEGHAMPLKSVYKYAQPDLMKVINGIEDSIPKRWMRCRALGSFEQMHITNRAQLLSTPQEHFNEKANRLHSKFGCPNIQAFITIKPEGFFRKVIHLEAHHARFGPSLPFLPKEWMRENELCIGGSQPCFELPEDVYVRPDPSVTCGESPTSDVQEPFSPIGHYDNMLWGFPIDKVSPFNACEPVIKAKRKSIALVMRGTCFFPIKVKNVQAAGYVGVIVINEKNKQLQVMTPVSPTDFTDGMTKKEREALMQASGLDTYIPAVMVSHEDGQRLLTLRNESPTERVYIYAR